MAAALADLGLDVDNTIGNLGWFDLDQPAALSAVISETMDLGRHLRRLIELVKRQEANRA
jgi:hypothetical protein